MYRAYLRYGIRLSSFRSQESLREAEDYTSSLVEPTSTRGTSIQTYDIAREHNLLSSSNTANMTMENLIDMLDPEIARQMGFTSFGGAKRRKLATTDAPAADEQPDANRRPSNPSGANATPLAQVDARDLSTDLPTSGLGIYGTGSGPSTPHRKHRLIWL